MQERITASRPYAQAAFEVAHEAGTLPAWSEGLAVLAGALRDPELLRLVKDPRVTPAQLFDIVTAVAGTRLDGPMRNFVRVLIEAERIDHLPEIAELFAQHRAAAEQRVEVDLTSAYPLDEAQQAALAAALRARVGRAIELKLSTDRGLIGGAVVRINDTVIDLSVRGRLQALAAGLGA